ncbi:MAG: diaminopimelate epimerase, partial [Alphaproteobacteria bacterium]
MARTQFRKMNGLGNDFVIVDARAGGVRPPADIIARLADRKTGIGFDQFITMEASPAGANAFMRIDNADGGEVAACGNATRCVASLLMNGDATAKGKVKAKVKIETRAGILVAQSGDTP